MKVWLLIEEYEDLNTGVRSLIVTPYQTYEKAKAEFDEKVSRDMKEYPDTVRAHREDYYENDDYDGDSSVIYIHEKEVL